ncbi:MAG: stage III sporulation protein AG [Bacillaceae bacterium]|nr:stage III sporulation protein AG [Bacillaceae bacterium]
MWSNSGDSEQSSEQKKIPILQKMLLVFLIGMGVMIVASFISVEKETLPPPTPAGPDEEQEQPAFSSKNQDYTIEDFENMYETQLKEILEDVVGVGEVEVMVNLDSTREIVVARNVSESQRATRETDQNKATRDIEDQSREEQVVLIQDDQGEQPVIIKTLKPAVRGVLVVARGAENIRIKQWIMEAVQRVLDVEPHRISILPKKG